MVIINRNNQIEEAMPQMVPSAGFTPPCDYTNFAENFDLSLLPGGEQLVSPQLYPVQDKTPPKIFTTFYPDSPPSQQPDFQTLLTEDKIQTPLYLEAPHSSQSPQTLSPNNEFNTYRQSSEANFYPSSPELSLYTPSPASIYSRSPCEDFSQFMQFGVKEEKYLSPCHFSSPTSPATSYSNLSSPEQVQPDITDLLENTVLDKQIKQESTVDFGAILGNFPNSHVLEEEQDRKPKDHQLLREVLRDTSFQKKYNIKPFDLGFIGEIKMEEPENEQNDLMRENIEPVLNLAIEQMRRDVDSTCAALGISPDPSQWSSTNVLSWLQWTSRQFGLSELNVEQWDMTGSNLTMLSEEDFTRRSPQGGMILHAQLEIWKAAYSEEEMCMNWLPETASSNASSGDISDDEDEETTTSLSVDPKPVPPAATTRPGGSHIHLWQFLKELLATPQTYGSCIRWMDRSKGIFKIEDSVKVARLWGKRKNRPAMNYDKLSRSIRQYYKKGIMKKTERSQRLVYQFCHPYNL